jgi:hypothetical protein
MMAGADKRWQQTRVEARTTAAEKRGQRLQMREGSGRGGERRQRQQMREEVDERWIKATVAADKRIWQQTRGRMVADERRLWLWREVGSCVIV